MTHTRRQACSLIAATPLIGHTIKVPAITRTILMMEDLQSIAGIMEVLLRKEFNVSIIHAPTERIAKTALKRAKAPFDVLYWGSDTPITTEKAQTVIWASDDRNAQSPDLYYPFTIRQLLETVSGKTGWTYARKQGSSITH